MILHIDDIMKGNNFSLVSKDLPRKDLYHQEPTNNNVFPNESPEFGNNLEKSTRKESFRKISAPFQSRPDWQIQKNDLQEKLPTNSDIEKEKSIFQRELEANHFSNRQSGQHDFTRQNLASHNLHYGNFNKTPANNRDMIRDDTSQRKQSRQKMYYNWHTNTRNADLNKRTYHQQQPLQQQFNNNPSNRNPVAKGPLNTGAYRNNSNDTGSYRKVSNRPDPSISNLNKELNHRNASYKESIKQQLDSSFTKFGDHNSSSISESARQESRSAFRKYSPSYSKADNSDVESNSRQYNTSSNISAYRSPNRFTADKNYPSKSNDTNQYNQQDYGQRYSVATEENKINDRLDHLDLQSGRDSPKSTKSTKSSSNILRSKSMTMLKSPYKQSNNQQRVRSQSSAINRPKNIDSNFDSGPYSDRQGQYF